MTHTYFSEWGSYAVTGGCVHAQATPSPKGVTAVSHPLQPSGLCTRGIPSHCSRLVCHLVARPHCRVCVRHSRAGRWRALSAVSPHSHVVTSPRRHSSRSRPTSPTASPWAAQWACGSSQLESTTSPTASPQGPKAVSSLVVRRPVLQTNCTFLGRAMGMWVIAEGVDQHPQLLSTSHQSGRIGCLKCRYCRT